MTEKTLTTENIKPALDALRGELAPWPVVAKKQDKLNDTQKSAVNSGITSSLVAQIIANTAAIRALESAITGTGLRALVVSSLPAVGTLGILYIVPVTTYDPETDADVVNYSNEYLWIVAPDAPVTEGYYEQVGQTGIVINNGQLTITVNGTSVGTFTANQSGDTTAAITVPTNADYVDLSTSQTIAGTKTFSDDIVGSITGTASKAIADEDGTSIKTGYGKLAGSQTWTGNNTFTGTSNLKNINIQKGTMPSANLNEAISFLDKNNASMGFIRYLNSTDGNSSIELRIENLYKDGQVDTTGTANYSYFSLSLTGDGQRRSSIAASLLPFHNSDYSLGSSSYQWSSVYAQSYYYNGTAWGLDKANEWTGSNKFKSANSNFGLQSTTAEAGSTTATSNWMYWQDKNGFQDAYISRDIWSDGSDTLRVVITGKRDNGAPSTSGASVECGIRLDITANGSKSVRPFDNGGTDLGTSTNKWKSLNGVNPGALSLPKTDGFVDIMSSITSIAGGVNRYTPTVNGWVSIAIKGGANNSVFLSDSVSYLSHGCYGSNIDTTDGRVAAYIPVIANQMIYIIVRCAQGEIYSARFFPCLGNV